MKIRLLFFLVSLQISTFAQHRLYAKINALTMPVLVLNAGLEYEVAPHFTIQADGVISPWKSFAGNHAQIYMGHLEGRYYFSENFRRWFAGANVGTGVYDITKWNYSGTNRFQRGFSFMVGVSGGYIFKISEKISGEVFLRIGNSQGFYHGYEYDPPSFTRYDGAEGWNKSGEVLPYGGGFMISYQIIYGHKI